MVVPFYDPGPHWLVRFCFRRGLALVYLIAFLVAARQFRPLAGESGLLPLADYRDRREFRERPSLFYLAPTDRAIGLAAWSGVGLSTIALLGVPERIGLLLGLPTNWPVGTVASMLVWGLMWVLYLSFVNAGQTFYGFGWESLLLEAGFLAIFLGGAGVTTPIVVIVLLRWVQFRNMFGAGLIKLRGDDCWRDLTCLEYHYETQPMPNPVSWFAHHLPTAAHRAGVVVNHVVELAVPFLYFAPQPIAAVAGLVTIGFQAWLMVTGNFSFLNALTIVLSIPLLSDPLLAAVLPIAAPATAPAGLVLWVPLAGVTLLVLALSYYPVRNMLSEGQRMNAAFDPLHLVNTYGAFGSITKDRYEVVIQGTREATVDEDTEWHTYEFPGKPTDPERLPPQWAPYHLRLDWQLWFAAMSTPRHNPWLLHLLAKLLAADPETLSLLRTDPFDGERPRHVRAELYRYRFTTPQERRETGQWWHREHVRTYYGPVSADDPRFRILLERQGWAGSLPDSPPEPPGPPEGTANRSNPAGDGGSSELQAPATDRES